MAFFLVSKLASMVVYIQSDIGYSCPLYRHTTQNYCPLYSIAFKIKSAFIMVRSGILYIHNLLLKIIVTDIIEYQVYTSLAMSGHQIVVVLRYWNFPSKPFS